MGKSKELATLTDDGGTFSGSLSVTGSNFASTTYTGTSVNPTGVYTGLTSDGGFTNNVRDSGYLQLSTNNVERMRIDASGRVTMPYQPAFDAGLTSGNVTTGTILFNNVRLNIGNHYSSSTGRFTAPISGLYEFYWGGIKNATTAVTRAVLYRNGAGVRENRLAEGISYTNACWKMLIELNASDYVEIQITAGDFYGSTDYYGNAFGGRLIG